MTREIKFRGEKIYSGHWVEGYVYHDQKFRDGVSCCDVFFIRDECDEDFEVKELTIGQFTGLEDIKGKEIYEGDVVEIETYSYEEPENSYKGIVHIGVYGFAVLGEDAMGTEGYYNLLEIEGSYTTKIEVVGNIYENPELLEGESND